MAVYIPNIDELTNKFKNNYARNLGVDVSDLGDSYIVESKVQAAAVYSIYLFLSKVQNNIYPDISEEDVLLRVGYSILGRYPSPASQGSYTVTATGTGTISAQTQFVANDDTDAAGYLFISDTDQSVPGTVTLRSLTSGIEPTLTVGDKLTSLQPLSGIDNEVEVATVVEVPVAAESIDSYRDDVLEGIRILPQGGSFGDYRLWTLEIPEIRTVYPVMPEPGNIDIYVEATEENTKTGETTGVPTQATLDEVYTAPDGADPESGSVIYDSVRELGRKPITVNNIEAKSVIPVSVDIVFTGLSDETVADAIATAIEATLYVIRPYIAGAQVPATKNDILTIGRMLVDVINVIQPLGVTYTTCVMEVDSSEVETYTFENGEYPYLNEITNDAVAIWP